jgi:hypothetical protein
MKIGANLRNGAFEWLAAILLSWWIPFQLFGRFPVTYFVSLILWGLPVALLFPRFLSATHRGSRRRRAFWIAVLYITVAGAALDLVFGAIILQFNPLGQYLYWLPALGGHIPIEEIIFYVLGGMAIALVYFWADVHWLAEYNVRRRRALIPTPGYLIDFSVNTAALGTAILVAGVLWRAHYIRSPSVPLVCFLLTPYRYTIAYTVPAYHAFLVALAFLPAIAIYRGIKDLVNWRAFSLTSLYVVLTAAVWEVTLALPDQWWGYRDPAMIGKYIVAWSRSQFRYPIEALVVWCIVTISVVFTYEAVQSFLYDDRPPRERLFGPAPWDRGPAPVAAPPPDHNVSIIVPAHNEAAILPRLRESLQRARFLSTAAGQEIEIIVANNGSTDETAEIATTFATVVDVPERSIAKARNGGAVIARHPILCFIDADIDVEPRTFIEIAEVLRSPRIVGGATGVLPDRWSTGIFVTWLAILPFVWITGYDAGVVFCRGEDFRAIGGYDESLRFAEDVDFLTRLRRVGRKGGRVLARIPSVKARASTRKFDRHGAWHYFWLLPLVMWSTITGRRSHRLDRYWYGD